ncbi:MAG: hypothetical protein QXM68_02565 [Candidatus Aenigmatarchaeota archaeon]|nr:hypothetical protein [Candidatus Aenigmarchaeota archaeon]
MPYRIDHPDALEQYLKNNGFGINERGGIKFISVGDIVVARLYPLSHDPQHPDPSKVDYYLDFFPQARIKKVSEQVKKLIDYVNPVPGCLV